jgi:hypothetical protein
MPASDDQTFKNSRKNLVVSSAKKNAATQRKMSICETETGYTVEELTEIQHSLKTDFLRRHA